jgi:rhodanese-related sulfurtransferase
VPNRVMSLSGGTQGWRLAGLDLESGVDAAPGTISADAIATARGRADTVASRFKVGSIDHATLALGRAEANRRTTYVLDVRTPEEFAAGHLPGSVSAPGGQLVQAIDRWVGTRGARLVLVDDTGTRAIMTAHWLVQMGWDVQVLNRALDGVELSAGHAEPAAGNLAAMPEIEPEEAAGRLAEGAAAIALEPSSAYRLSHPQGAVWANRARLDRLLAAILGARQIILFADDMTAARLAAVDLGELTTARLAAVRGGASVWRRAGLPVASSPEDPPDSERIDYLFWNHDRHSGNAAAMRAYLHWETELPEQITADGLAGFRIDAP